MRIFVVAIIFFFLSVAPALAENYQSPKYLDMSETYGFLLGQQYALDFIKQEFPDLKLEAERVELGFSSVFGKARDRLKDDLIKTMQGHFEEYQNKMKEQIGEKLTYENVDVSAAQQILQEIEGRSKGNLPSPVLETLLTYNYQNDPAREFLEGFKNKFNTGGHEKSKGLEVEFQYPKSWKAREGNRPNVIQSIRSENGRGPVSVLIMVRDFVQEAGDELSKEEIEAFKTAEGSEYLADDMFTAEALADMAHGMGMDNVHEISSKRIIIDNWPAAALNFKAEAKRLDFTLSVYNRLYITLYKNYMILLQFQMMKLPDESDEDFSQVIAKYDPLLMQIANSVVIQDQY